MIVDKKEIKNKLLEMFENCKTVNCSICGETIAKYEIENLDFEYCKTETNENYAHARCVNKMIKK